MSRRPSALESELGLRRVAARQLQLFTTEQALAEGWNRQRLHRWCRADRIHRVHGGVYRFAGAPVTWTSVVLAAVLACGPGAVASHRTAMALHGIPPARRDRRTRIEVSIPSGRDIRPAGIVMHRVLLPPEHVTIIDGVPCTTYERTLIDSAARLGGGQLGRGIDEGLVGNDATLVSIRHALEQLRPAPGRQRARVARVLAARAPGSDAADSRPEIRLLAAISDAGLPPPVVQCAVTVDGEVFFIDAAYPDLLLGIEYLGWDPHRTKTKFDADHRRDRLLTVAGWSILYFTAASTSEIVDHIKRVRDLRHAERDAHPNRQRAPRRSGRTSR
jgi:hypothetical protein